MRCSHQNLWLKVFDYILFRLPQSQPQVIQNPKIFWGACLQTPQLKHSPIRPLKIATVVCHCESMPKQPPTPTF